MEVYEENKNKIQEIENKTNSELLISYLEPLIGDEMILNSFIRDLKIIKSTDTSVIIQAPSEQVKLYIEQNEYLQLINQTIESIYNKNLEAKIVLKNDNQGIEDNLGKTKNISKRYTFDNYVISKFNDQVVSIAKKIIESPGKFSPFFISSKSGLGKTHLLHAIGNEVGKKGQTAIYIEPNKFTKEISEMSKNINTSVTSYVDEVKKYDFLIFDDIQNLGDRAVTLKILFELVNNHIEKGKQIVIASDKTVRELSGFESRFITRFSSGLTGIINEPDVDDLIKVLEKKIQWEGMNPAKWEREALRFIARNNSSSIRAIEGAIKRVAFFTENESNIEYTFNVVSNIFKELTIEQSEMTPQRIILTVCNYYKINQKDIIGKSRKKEFIMPRYITIWLIKKMLDLPLVEIGKIFSNRDHSTIISSIKRIDSDIEVNRAVKLAVKKIEEKVLSIS